MKYAVIDTAGKLAIRDRDGWWLELINDEVGPEGHARVPTGIHHISGWVNDCGLLAPERYPRNVVGSIALQLIGAGPQPYAGPVVLTGWDPGATAYGDIEVRSLTRATAEMVTALVADIRSALGLDTGRRAQLDRREWAAWCDRVRTLAGRIGAAPTPHLRVLGGDL